MSCLREAEDTCRSAKHRVIKLLRMTLDNLVPVLQTNRRLKIIHLLRDPRGILNSHLDDGSVFTNNQRYRHIRARIQVLCERLQWDIKAGQELMKMFSDRFKIIHYESFGNLTGVASDLYKFLGMSHTSEQQTMLEFLAKPTKTRGFHPFNYRTRLPWDIVNMFETECSEVLDQLGYARYESEIHLRNLSRPGVVRNFA